MHCRSSSIAQAARHELALALGIRDKWTCLHISLRLNHMLASRLQVVDRFNDVTCYD